MKKLKHKWNYKNKSLRVVIIASSVNSLQPIDHAIKLNKILIQLMKYWSTWKLMQMDFVWHYTSNKYISCCDLTQSTASIIHYYANYKQFTVNNWTHGLFYGCVIFMWSNTTMWMDECRECFRECVFKAMEMQCLLCHRLEDDSASPMRSGHLNSGTNYTFIPWRLFYPHAEIQYHENSILTHRPLGNLNEILNM